MLIFDAVWRSVNLINRFIFENDNDAIAKCIWYIWRRNFYLLF